MSDAHPRAAAENGPVTDKNDDPPSDAPVTDAAGVADAAGADDEVAAGGSGARPSGLKNPGAAVRGVGAATLILEFLVLLLAIQPLRILLPDASGAAAGVAAGLAFACLLAAGLLGRRWAWPAVTVLQVVIVATGVVHWMLGVVGGIFLLVWIYVLNVRKTILGDDR